MDEDQLSDEDTRLHNSNDSCEPVSTFNKDRFARIISSYTTYLVYNFEKAQMTLSKILISSNISTKSKKR